MALPDLPERYSLPAIPSLGSVRSKPMNFIMRLSARLLVAALSLCRPRPVRRPFRPSYLGRAVRPSVPTIRRRRRAAMSS